MKVLGHKCYSTLCSSHLLKVLLGLQAPSSAGGLDDLSVRVEAFGEALVVTAVTGRTDLRVTLVLQHAVQALGVLAAWTLVCRFAVAAWDFREVSNVQLHLPKWLIGLR